MIGLRLSSLAMASWGCVVASGGSFVPGGKARILSWCGTGRKNIVFLSIFISCYGFAGNQLITRGTEHESMGLFL